MCIKPAKEADAVTKPGDFVERRWGGGCQKVEVSKWILEVLTDSSEGTQ